MIIRNSVDIEVSFETLIAMTATHTIDSNMFNTAINYCIILSMCYHLQHSIK